MGTEDATPLGVAGGIWGGGTAVLATGKTGGTGTRAGAGRGTASVVVAAVRTVTITAPTDWGLSGRSSVTAPDTTSCCLTFPSRNQ